MKYEDSIDEAIWIERMENNLTYSEIQKKIGVSYYRIKKVINERLTKGKRGKRKSKRKNKKGNLDK